MKQFLIIISVYALILLAHTTPIPQDYEYRSSAESKEFESLELESSEVESWEPEATSIPESQATLTSEMTPTSTTSTTTITSTTTTTTTTRTTTRRPRPTLPRPTRPFVDALTQHLTNMNTIFGAVATFVSSGLGHLGDGLFGNSTAPGNTGGNSRFQQKLPVIEPAMDEIPTLRDLDGVYHQPGLNYLPGNEFNESEFSLYRMD